MKVVLDANVLIAAFAARGLCHAVFEYCLDSHRIVLSETIVAETLKNLKKKLKLSEQRIQEVSELILPHAEIVQPLKVDPSVCRDENDLMVLGTAASAAASYIVTGDDDLLILSSYSGIPILRPREFWERMKQPLDR